MHHLSMAIFDSLLKSGETLFANELALDFSFQPKLLLHREKEQFAIANTLRPLFAERTGKNMLIYGRPGIGKTIAVRHVFREIEEEHEGVLPLYVNCWQHNSTYKISIALCDIIGYKFYQNKKTTEIFKDIQGRLNKTAVAFCFDEVDKLEDFDFLYTVLEEIYRKSIILISNYKEWYMTLDERLRSRLQPELLEFREYSSAEIQDILAQRLSFAFHAGVFQDDAFAAVVRHTVAQGDIRAGLHVMRLAAEAAEEASSRVITSAHVATVLEKSGEVYMKDAIELDGDCQKILDIIKGQSGQKIGDVFKKYEDAGGEQSYKTFTRKIHLLSSAGFLSLEKVSGSGGNTTILHHQQMKRLTEY